MGYSWTTGETITAEKLNNTGGYDIVLRLNTIEGDIQSITQISMDFNAVTAKAEALQPITALVYSLEQEGDYTTFNSLPAQPNYNLYQGTLSALFIFVGSIDGAAGYTNLVYDPVGDEWFED